MSDDKAKRSGPGRSKISMHEDYEVRYRVKRVRDELQKLVDKVGHSAAAVCKELGER